MTWSVYRSAQGLGPEASLGVELARASRALAEVQTDSETFQWPRYEEGILAVLQPAMALVAFGGPGAPRLVVNALADLAFSSDETAGWDDAAHIRGALLSRIVLALTAAALAYDRLGFVVEFKRLRRGAQSLLSDASLSYGPQGGAKAAEGPLFGVHSRWFVSRGWEEPGLLGDRKRRASWIAEADVLLAMVCAHRSKYEVRCSALADDEVARAAAERLASRFEDRAQSPCLAELFDCERNELLDTAKGAYGNLIALRADGPGSTRIPPVFG